MSTISAYKINVHRQLCLKKDLDELNSWTNMLETFNTELDHLAIIEKQLIKMISVSLNIQATRRKIVLNMANLCKYEQELKKEFEYGKIEYDESRLKVHDHKRNCYLKLVEEYQLFKIQLYTNLKKYQRK